MILFRRLLIADVGGIELFLGQIAVETGYASLLSGLLEALELRLILVNDFGGIDLVDLVQATYSALNNFDQDQSLNDRIAGSTDVQVLHICFSKNSQCIAEILLNLAL
jgi:hypothetical protein